MEYTALLAGQPFSDAPRCVDPELASILRGANDTLGDENRPALVPLLGRAIGLVVERSDDGQGWLGRLWRTARPGNDGAAARIARLHSLVSEKFVAVVGLPTDRAWTRWYGHYARVSEMFWDLMSEPTSARTSREYTCRLIERLELLHRCYEEALLELGLPTPAGDDRTPRPAEPAAEGDTVGLDRFVLPDVVRGTAEGLRGGVQDTERQILPGRR